MQEESATARLPTILMIPLTTQVEALRFPGTVLVDVDPQNGLKRPSVALVFQLTVVDRRAIGASLGRVSDAVLEEIWSALDRLTGRTD